MMNRMKKSLSQTPEQKPSVNMIQFQFNQQLTYQKIEEIISSICSYSWQGFREKDLALSLVLQAYKTVLVLESSNEKDTPEKEIWEEFFLRAIEKIGYPSQILYQAHKQKRAIRDLAQIADIATNTKHRRFAEAWLYISSVEPRLFSENEVLEIMHLINRVIKIPRITTQPIVRSKISECFFNFASRLDLDK